MNRVDSHNGKGKLKFPGNNAATGGRIFEKTHLNYLEEVLKEIPIPENKRTEYFRHAEKIALKRIDAIVANKHRKSYWKAARLLLAVGEVYWSNGETIEGQKLIDRVREKYRHHSAFRSELRNRAKKAGVFTE